jgi:hypothetical protein
MKINSLGANRFAIPGTAKLNMNKRVVEQGSDTRGACCDESNETSGMLIPSSCRSPITNEPSLDPKSLITLFNDSSTPALTSKSFYLERFVFNDAFSGL